MSTMADKPVTLPTTRLLAAAWLGAIVSGLGWAGLASVVSEDRVHVSVGPVAAGLVGVAATISLLAIRPWVPKSLMRWPTIWVAGSFGRMACTLGGAVLLYSATPLRTTSLWLAVAVAYFAALIGETRVYVQSMQRLGVAIKPNSGGDTPSSSGPSAISDDQRQ